MESHSVSKEFVQTIFNKRTETSKWRITTNTTNTSVKMGCCLRKQVSKPPELFRHTSLLDEDNNFYIDQNERLHTLLELDEVRRINRFQKKYFFWRIIDWQCSDCAVRRDVTWKAWGNRFMQPFIFSKEFQVVILMKCSDSDFHL